MLSIAKAKSRDYLLDQARKDYYLKGGEPPGLWYGKGAAHLGLTGEVEKPDFKKLWSGFDPKGNKLVQNAGTLTRQKAWDLVFSAPKSVSTVWAVTEDPELRKAIQEAHDKAVREALDYLERVAGLTRTGKGGHTHEEASLIFALFQHSTSRANDPEPQLHTHAELFNIAIRESIKPGSLQSALHTPLIYRHIQAAGALYQASFARGIEQLHFAVVQEKKFGFEIAGVPKELRDHFSTRSQEIEQAKKERGLTSQKAGDIAALTTRGEKNKDLTRAELFSHCKEVGRDFKFEHQHIEKLRSPERTRANPQQAADRLAKTGAKDLAEKNSYFTEGELTKYVGQKAPGTGAGAHEIKQAVHTVLAVQTVCLGDYRDEKQYTTPEMLQREVNMLDQAAKLHARSGPEVTPKALDSLFEKYDTLKPEQRGAIQYLTDHTLQLALVSGVAGAGKGYTLGVAKEAWEESGYTVLGLAPTGKAATGLRDAAGINAFTIDKVFYALDKNPKREDFALTPQHVIVVDEAGMANVPQMERIFQWAEAAGAKVCLIGDPDQLPPIEAGAPYRALAERFGEYELTEIVRQEKKWHQDAVQDIREGKASDALSAYLKEGHFHLGSTREHAKEALINTWHKEGDIQNSLILASTNAEVSELNRMAQDKRGGDLGETSIKIGAERIHEADRVVFTKNSYQLGVMNGHFGTVTGINKLANTVTVQTDSGKDITFSAAHYDSLQLGYASTVHKAQGATVDTSYVLLGETMQDRNLSYVQLSRHRKEAELFIDRETAGDKFQDVIARMEQIQEKKLAVELHQERAVDTFLRNVNERAEDLREQERLRELERQRLEEERQKELQRQQELQNSRGLSR